MKCWRRVLFLVLLLMPAEVLADSALPPLHMLSPAALDSLLGGLPARFPQFEDRLCALARARMGAPYALGTLGEENAEDPDPVFRVDEADCTVLVLTTAALAHARNRAEALVWMGPLNYRRRGDVFPIEYRNRLHFTEDRVTASPLFADLTAAVALPAERKTVSVTLNRNATGEELLPLGWERAITLDYVPAAKLAPVLPRVPAVCGIAFVREATIPRGFFVAHEGFLLDRHVLLHASKENGKVATVDVLEYLLRTADLDPEKRGRPRFDGAILYGFVEGAPDLVSAGSGR